MAPDYQKRARGWRRTALEPTLRSAITLGGDFVPSSNRLAAVLLLLAGLLPSLAAADRVTVKGAVLEGKVKSVDGKNVVMETVYGKGDLTIAVADLEAIETDVPFHLFHGDHVETVGKVVGVSADAIQVEPEGAAPVEVATSELWVVRRDKGPEAGLLERAHYRLPFWTARFDLAFAATQATDDTLSLATDLGIQRSRGPNRTRLGARYRLGIEKEDGESSDKTANEIYGIARQEHDFSQRFYGFASVDGEYDEIESLSFRTVPKIGPGVHLYKSESAWLDAEVGVAYVYERFFGGDTNRYPGAAFGAESDWKLPVLGASWHNRLDYTPSFKDFFGDYLLRFETGLLIPMTEWISFKLSVVDAYDSTPAEDAKKNSLSTLVGLALGF
jgi:hypothetical protein